MTIKELKVWFSHNKISLGLFDKEIFERCIRIVNHSVLLYGTNVNKCSFAQQAKSQMITIKSKHHA